MYINKLYKTDSQQINWEALRSDRAALISPKEIDFSVSGAPAREGYLRTALKVILLPWGLYLAAQWFVQRLIMTRLYPAQSRVAKMIIPEFRTGSLDQQRLKEAESLAKKGFIVRHVALERNGLKSSGLLIAHKDHCNNGKWALQATGNIQPVEYAAEMAADLYHNKGYNVLLINNPGVGRSEGTATPETMGDTQETGIRFLETAMKANKIVLAGYSLGGAAVGLAIKKHKFRPDIKYLAVRQMTFNKVSSLIDMVYKITWASSIVKWANCEMDSVAASRKLQLLGIPEVIIQSSDGPEFISDGTIPGEATLVKGIQEELESNHTKRFVGLHKADHTDERIKSATVSSIHTWERDHSLWGRVEDTIHRLIDF